MNPHQIPLPDLTYPRAPYQRHSETSREAAESLPEPVLNALQQRVLEFFQGRDGATDEEMIEATGLSPSTARPRRVELVALSLIADSGEKRPTRSGRKAVVWRIVEGASR